MTPAALAPLLEALFPGINYRLPSFSQAMHHYAKPVLKKRFPELVSMTAEAVAVEGTKEIAAFLPSQGNQWQDDRGWDTEFQRRLTA